MTVTPGSPRILTRCLETLAAESRRVRLLAVIVLCLTWTALLARPAAAQNYITWNNANWYLLGNNYPWQNYGTDFGTGGWGKFTNWTTIANNFAAMKGQKVRLARWWVFGDGRYDPKFNADGTVSGLDTQFYSDLDQALQVAANNNVYLLLCLMDFSMWNNASFSGSVQMGGHAAIVTNATVQQSYLNNALKPLLQHIAASPNRSSVLGYDIINEPEWNMAGYGGGVNLSASQVMSFVQQCAGSIHANGGGGYATVGSAKPGWTAAWKNLGLDFYQTHYYPWMDNGGPAGNGLPTYTSLGLDKPCIVGEFSTVDANYSLGSTTPQSAQWYLDTISNFGYAGALGWSYQGGDSASNWSAFQPVHTNWANGHIIGPDYAPTFTAATTISPTTLAPGATSTITTTVTDTRSALYNGAVNIDVWNASGVRVNQQAWTGQSFATNQQRTYSYTWTAPGTPGTYTVDIGVFSTNWAATYYYQSAGTITVTGSGGGDTAQYNFESGTQGWASTGGMITGVSQSSAQKFAGSSSLAVSFHGAAGDKQEAYVSSPSTPAGKTVTYHIWIPAGSKITAVQPFVQQGSGGGWTWTGNWQPIGNLKTGAWNTLTVTVPSNAVTPLFRLGVEFTTNAAWTGTCYVDSISW
jgi:hypothetical protein